MEQWEYKTLKIKTGGFLGGKVDEQEFEEELNRLGLDGWELVSCFDTSLNQGQSRDVIAVCKRARRRRTGCGSCARSLASSQSRGSWPMPASSAIRSCSRASSIMSSAMSFSIVMMEQSPLPAAGR
ncbi:DUF4177 domain-containing protein [Paenibacillus melissococcoides]|uniref:DUF4177 domain-containing protein n=2 Tax=Paenibacillus melissococcoides TaxID=2912268 RepID=A0ABM9G407_9BACL|nr:MULTISPECIES: DUF4177 domain-containing protein [Paenibacillus]MEB9892260.1 DUF4177 domain-containing protein [Bacillus cereus]CAH8245913.1 DUF4177 domain-containing protein [Paenibacillus melissococcoides]CAH8712447.1 DUF4177 domain-containing protein [Paenibacillus melissococcoides]CAH8713193.1 DUF4177 domain-containing protein [Paenibacillus melissococcoides]